MQLERILRKTPATLTVTFYGDEGPINADAGVTVTVTSIDGTAITTGSAYAEDPTNLPGVYNFALPAQTDLDIFTVNWAGTFEGEAAEIETLVEIVGGYVFNISEARQLEGLESATRFPSDKIRSTRNRVEIEFEDILGFAILPRYGRIVRYGDGTAEFDLGWPHPQTIRVIKVDGVDVTTDLLPLLQVTESGYLIHPEDGGWAATSQIEVIFEHGKRIPDLEIKEVALVRARHLLAAERSGIPDRATSYVADEGGVYRLAVAGRYGYHTGLPDVDAVLNRKSMKTSGSGVW